MEAGAKAADANPYLNARREWNERYGSYIAQAHNWRLAAFGSLGIALLAVGALGYAASRNRLVPYVVEVDKLGASVAVQRADAATAADPRIIRAQLARWVVAARQVVVDASALRQGIRDAYATLDQHGPAREALHQLYRANHPYKRAEKETVTVEVKSVLPLTGQTWRVEWEETVRDLSGRVLHAEPWQASVTISVRAPTEEGAILLNPMGVYVNSFSWSKRI